MFWLFSMQTLQKLNIQRGLYAAKTENKSYEEIMKTMKKKFKKICKEMIKKEKEISDLRDRICILESKVKEEWKH